MRSSRKNQRGAALLTVLVALMVITLMTMELQYTAIIERKLAYNDLNSLQAYYLAKSGARIGLLRVSLYGRVKRDKMVKSMGKGMDLDQYLNMIWNMPLPPFPPTVSDIAKLGLKEKGDAEQMAKETKVTGGQSSHVISNESAKINLNYLVLPQSQKDEPVRFPTEPKNLVEYVGMLLYNLVDGFIRASNDPAEEFGALRPETLVYDIMDWVNPGENSYNGGAKDTFYEQQKPPYKAKRGRFFTNEEVKLVRSIDENLYAKLRPHVTVYSYGGKININNASKTMYQALYPDFTEDDLKRLVEERDRLGAWPSEKSFVDFVTNDLNRSGFKNIYNDEKNYPFTVASQSFLIDALGTIKKSGSQINRSIRVAVALVQSQSAATDATINDAPTCVQNQSMFWDTRSQKCTQKPRSEEACKFLAGQWTQENGKFGCRLNQLGIIFPPDQQGPEEPNALKILSWMEG